MGAPCSLEGGWAERLQQELELAADMVLFGVSKWVAAPPGGYFSASVPAWIDQMHPEEAESREIRRALMAMGRLPPALATAAVESRWWRRLHEDRQWFERNPERLLRARALDYEELKYLNAWFSHRYGKELRDLDGAFYSTIILRPGDVCGWGNTSLDPDTLEELTDCEICSEQRSEQLDLLRLISSPIDPRLKQRLPPALVEILEDDWLKPLIVVEKFA